MKTLSITSVGFCQSVSNTYSSTSIPGYTFAHSVVTDANGSGVQNSSSSRTVTVTRTMSDKRGYVRFMYNVAPPTTYTLTVSSGSGSGNYTSGTSVGIVANAPASGKRFKNWTISGVGTIANANSSSTTFTMGAGTATVTANYENIYTLTVSSGSGGGSYASGQVVNITANSPPSGKQFDKWTVSGGGTITNTNSSSTTFTMSSGAATVTATYKDILTAPTITTQPSNKTVTAGQSATFSITASGSPTLTYQWQVYTTSSGSWSNYGTDSHGAKTNTLTLPSVAIQASGNKYRCVVTNSAGSITSSDATLTVNPIAVTGVTLNKNSTSIIINGIKQEQLIATVAPSNATNKAVTWSSNNTNIVTVDTNGVLTGVAAGTTTVKVTTVDGNKTATCTVTVKEYKYELTVKHVFDTGYRLRFDESQSAAKLSILEYAGDVATQYKRWLGLKLTSQNPDPFISEIDLCKATKLTGGNSSDNINELCSGVIHAGTNVIHTCTNRERVTQYIPLYYQGSSTTTIAFWSGHKIMEPDGTNNRSWSYGGQHTIYMLDIDTTNRDRNSKGILMHELNHQIGGPDHYHDITDNDDSTCKRTTTNGGNGLCSNTTCNTNNGTTNRSSTCIMNNSRQGITSTTIICGDDTGGCYYDILTHLNAHHNY